MTWVLPVIPQHVSRAIPFCISCSNHQTQKLCKHWITETTINLPETRRIYLLAISILYVQVTGNPVLEVANGMRIARVNNLAWLHLRLQSRWFEDHNIAKTMTKRTTVNVYTQRSISSANEEFNRIITNISNTNWQIRQRSYIIIIIISCWCHTFGDSKCHFSHPIKNLTTSIVALS